MPRCSMGRVGAIPICFWSAPPMLDGPRWRAGAAPRASIGMGRAFAHAPGAAGERAGAPPMGLWGAPPRAGVAQGRALGLPQGPPPTWCALSPRPQVLQGGVLVHLPWASGAPPPKRGWPRGRAGAAPRASSSTGRTFAYAPGAPGRRAGALPMGFWGALPQSWGVSEGALGPPQGPPQARSALSPMPQGLQGGALAHFP